MFVVSSLKEEAQRQVAARARSVKQGYVGVDTGCGESSGNQASTSGHGQPAVKLCYNSDSKKRQISHMTARNYLEPEIDKCVELVLVAECVVVVDAGMQWHLHHLHWTCWGHKWLEFLRLWLTTKANTML